MKIYKDTNNQVHEIDIGFESLLPAGSVEITRAQADVLLAPPPLTKAEKMKLIEVALQDALDTEAQSLGYDDINTAVSYAADSTVPSFQADGQSFLVWRSTVWAYAYAALAQYDADSTQYDIDKAAYDVLLTQYDIDMIQWLIDVVADSTLVALVSPIPPTVVVEPTVTGIISKLPIRIKQGQ